MKDAAQVVALMLEDEICAWCQKERGEQPLPGQSHGICARHKEEMQQELERLKAERNAQRPVAQITQTPPQVS